MERFDRSLRRVLLAVVVAISLAASPAIGRATTTSTASAASAAAVEPPNVVVFLLDDAAAADLRYLTGIRELLGSEGLTFTQAIAQNPLCCPARAQLMTGQLSHNNGVFANDGVHSGVSAMADRENTIAVWMHDAGYQTAFAGKYIHGYALNIDLFGPDGIPAGWDHWDATLLGATNYWHFTTFEECPAVGDTACQEETYAERRYTTTTQKNKTLALIDRFRQADAPFFLFAAWTAPHKDSLDQYNAVRYPKAPPRYHRASDGRDFDRRIARKPSFNERDLSDKTPDLRGPARAAIARDAKPTFTGRVAALRAVDEAITEIIGHLKDTGESDNTLVVLTSDNGFLNGEHRLLYKKWEYDESLAVPLLLSWPDGGIPVGVTDRTATLVDLPATILAASGATSQRSSVDGISLLDTVPTTVRRYEPTPLLIGSGAEFASVGDPDWAYQGIRWGPYTWTRHWGRQGEWTREQFYDAERDPYQIRSQPMNPWYRKNIIITMREYFAALKGCAGPEECVPPDRRPIRALDPDHDGLWSWYERHHYGTDADDPDTDGDGSRDGKDRYPLDPERQ